MGRPQRHDKLSPVLYASHAEQLDPVPRAAHPFAFLARSGSLCALRIAKKAAVGSVDRRSVLQLVSLDLRAPHRQPVVQHDAADEVGGIVASGLTAPRITPAVAGSSRRNRM